MAKNWLKKIEIDRNRKIMKNIRNWQNTENGKIEMRPFGTLSEPPEIQKKCSEKLRWSSIGRSCQMMRSGTGKMSKWSVCFWIRNWFVNVLLLTVDFFLFWVLEWLWKIRFRSQKLNFRWNFDQKHFSAILDNFYGKWKKMRFAQFQKSRKKIKFHQNVKKTCLGISFLMFFELQVKIMAKIIGALGDAGCAEQSVTTIKIFAKVKN